MPTRIQLRRDTATNWTTLNPVLSDGEFGLNKTSGKLKLGDGVTAWNTLPDYSPPVYLEDIFVNGAPEGSSIFVHHARNRRVEYVPATPVVGGPVTNLSNTGFLTPRVLTGTEAQYSDLGFPVGTLRYASDYPSYRLGVAISNGVVVDEFSPVLMLGDPLQLTHLTQDGATTGQVLKWNGTYWAPAADSTGGGSSTVPANTEAGWGTTTIAENTFYAVSDTQSLFFMNVGGGGAFDEGAQVITSNSTISLAQLANSGATTGQVLKWTGAAWAPGNDSTGSGGGGSSGGGPVSGTWGFTNIPYGSFGDWETYHTDYVMPQGSLFVLGDEVKFANAAGLGFDECPALMRSDAVISIAQTSGPLSSNRVYGLTDILVCGGETDPLDTGYHWVFRRMGAGVLQTVRGSLSVAQSAGFNVTIDIKKNGTSIFSTKLTFDNGETTTKTAATQAVLSTTSFADDDEIDVIVHGLQSGSAAAGLKIYLIWANAV